jgi:hypothetical protein
MNEPQRLVATVAPRESDSAPGRQFSARLRARVAAWRKRRLLRLALRVAEEPILMLEVSQAPGLFWPVLTEHNNRVIVATSPAAESLLEAHRLLPQGVTRRIRVMPGPLDYAELRPASVDCILLAEIPPSECNANTLRLLSQLHHVTRDSAILFARVGSQRPAPQAGAACRCGDSHAVAAEASHARALEQEFLRIGFSQIRHYNFTPGSDGVRVYILRK